MASGRAPVADRLFTEEGGQPQLLGARCEDCGVITFPAQHGCPRCSSEQMTERPLARRGTLWSFTTQGFPPKAPYVGPADPETYEPYAIGYVELPGEVIVEARLTETDPEILQIGMEMELTLVPFRETDDGVELVTYAFRPVE